MGHLVREGPRVFFVARERVGLPEGRSVEDTDAVLAEMAQAVRGVAEVVDVTTWAGTASPIDFNGMVRRYYQRQAPNLAELRNNFV